MDKIKKIIIGLTILIIVILVILIVLLKGNTNQQNNDGEEFKVEEFDEGIVYESNTNGFQILDDPNVFFSITNVVSKYLSAIYYDADDIQNNLYNIKTKEEQAKVLSGLLDINDKNNIQKYLDNISYNFNMIPIEIKVRYQENITTYILNVYLENKQSSQLENKFFIVRVDNQNSSFAIEPILEKVNNIDDISVEDKGDSIHLNDYNAYEIETISMERLVKIYMDHFLRMMVDYPDIAYYNYLHEEYKKERFGDLQEFKNYVEKNREEIQSIRATQYLIDDENGNTKYVILDQYKNTYEFYETNTMKYKVKLDNYIVPSEELKNTYKSATDKKKVAMNVDRWIQMLNNRDYSSAYQVLDETFRNNTYGSEEQLETTMREILPSHYKIENTKVSQEGNTYVLNVILSDITQETEEKRDIDIFMQLKDDMDFVMSFDFK